MAEWHHQCSGHELGQTSGDDEGRGPGMLQSLGSQRVKHDWETQQQQQHTYILLELPVISVFLSLVSKR